MPIQNRNYYGAIQTGREDALQQQAMQQRNALGRMEVGRQQQFNALAQNPDATADQYTRIGRSDVGNALLNQQQFGAQQKRVDSERLFMAAQYGINSQRPKDFIAQNFPEIAAMNPNFAQESDEQVRASLQDLLGKFGPQAGIGPAPAPVQYERQDGPRGSVLQRDPRTGELKQVVGPDNTQPSASQSNRFRALTPKEVSEYGLPPGSSAQVNDATGQVQVLNKPSVAPQQTAAERKAVLEAKVKMPRVSAAMRRAERLDQAIQAIGKNTFADGGPADAKVLQYSKDGREVMAAAAQLMPELQALTRVPGIGSQSDLEARLASLALPSLEFDPQTNAKSMAELHAFIQDLKAAYETIASGGAPPNEVPDEAGPAVVAPTLDEIRAKYGR
jgi:hypothetical protein